MSNRNKKNRSTRSAFKLEALEPRQLLATIVGGTGGTEAGSDITVSGKVYDQILMTGSTLSVMADPGQIVRVDFLDADGDIVRAEFSGSGTLNISLANFAAAATATKYTISGTKYVGGLASYTVTNSDATTNFLTTSLGPVTAFNGLLNPIFASGATVGGNSTANVARLVVVGDSTNLVGGAGTAFGSIFAGNAVFGDTSGVVGIYAPNTSFKAGNTITIGDIAPASTTATPIIHLGTFSDVKTVSIAGGKLATVSGGVDLTTPTVLTLASTTGTNSLGTKLATQTLVKVGTSTASYSSGLGTVTIDGSTATQASLDTLASGQYLQDVVINNGLPAGLVLKSFQFGNITLTGNLAGVITTDANNNNRSDSAEQGIGNVTITGDIVDGGYIESATTIGNVTVTGKITHTVGSGTITVNSIPGVPNQIAVISTIGRSGTTAAIGNVSVTGDITIGTSTTPVAEGLISAGRGLTTANAAEAVASSGGIGTISGANLSIWSSLPSASNPGIITHAGPSGQSIGAVTFTGDVVVTNTTAGSAGFISSVRHIGAVSVKSLTLTTPTGGIATTANNGNIGTISSTGSGGITLIQGSISANANGSVGAISVASPGNLYIGASTAGVANGNTAQITGGSIGSITVTSGNLTQGTAAGILATNGNVGAITLSNGNLNLGTAVAVRAIGGNVGDILISDTTGGSNINGKITAQVANSVGGAIGNVTVTKGNLSFGAAGQLDTVTGTAGTSIGNVTVSSGNLAFSTATSLISATTKVGDITVKGNLSFGAVGAMVKSGTGSAAGTSIGNITVTAGSLIGVDNNIEFQANQIGNVSVTGASGTAIVIKDVIFSAKGTTQSTIASAKIGDITLNSAANSTGELADATGAAIDNNSGTGFSSSGNIGNVTLTTASGTAAGTELVLSAGGKGNLFIIAGSSEGGAVANVPGGQTATAAVAAGFAVNTASGATTSENVESVTIGNVSINGNIAGSTLNTNNGTVGTGLIIAAGVNNAAGGLFRTASNAATNLAMPTALTSGTINSVVISDLTGGVVKTPFSNGVLGVITSNDVAGGSIIVADRISTLTVNSGAGAILNLTGLTGLPLKGALGDATSIPVATNQQYVGAATSNLVIVVL